MQVVLTDIELDIQELKCLMDAYTREPNIALREVIKRNIIQMRGRLDTLLAGLDTVPPVNEPKPVAAEVEPVRVVIEPVEPITEEVLPDVVEESLVVVAPIESVEEKPVLTPTPILGERIKTAVDLRRSISLNDSFRFSRELFDGDTEQMNRVLQQIGEMSTYAAATSFLSSKMKVGEENEAMADLLELLKKYFN